jgi:putative Mg2+ transporter-C (MgtC) family protein
MYSYRNRYDRPSDSGRSASTGGSFGLIRVSRVTLAGAVNVDNLVGRHFWLPVSVAILCGLVLGLERQLRGKPAGIRTSILICMGTAVFVRLGNELAGHGGDPTRTLGQVVTGIGFLGGGVILTQGGAIRGMTSAAVIWILAGIGSAIGIGRYAEAVALSVISAGVLVGVQWLERSFLALRRGVHADDNPEQPPR